MDFIKILKNISVFNGFEDYEFEKIIPVLKILNFEQDAIVITEGDIGNSMYILIKGSVKVIKRGVDNDEILITYLYPGSYFGELALIDNLPRSAGIVTIEPTVMLKLKKIDFDKILNSNITIAKNYYKNTLLETFSRFRKNLSQFTFAQHVLKEQDETLNEISQDLESAREIQDLFITVNPGSDKTDIRNKIKYDHYYLPCSEVGGDFLNLVPLDDENIAILIADVAGHGVTASMGTGVIKTAFSFLIDNFGKKPSEFLFHLNNYYYKIMPRLHATCYYALLNVNTMKIRLAKAGHQHPIFRSQKKQSFIEIDSTGTGIGIIPDKIYTESEHQLEKGDSFLFFTDGIIEQINENNEMYSENRLKKLYENILQEEQPNVIKSLIDDLMKFSGKQKIEDDVTLLFLQV